MKGMSHGLRLGKSCIWGMFITMFKYKAELRGKQLLKIDKFYLRSKIFFVYDGEYNKTKLNKINFLPIIIIDVILTEGSIILVKKCWWAYE